MLAYILISTNGKQINHIFTLSYEDARKEMVRQFEALAPTDLKGLSDDYSYIDDYDAALYASNELYLWKIVEIMGDNQPTPAY